MLFFSPLNINPTQTLQLATYSILVKENEKCSPPPFSLLLLAPTEKDEVFIVQFIGF
jgi:hypothetical protein